MTKTPTSSLKRRKARIEDRKNVHVEVEHEPYLRLRAMLVMERMSFSVWLDNAIKKTVN